MVNTSGVNWLMGILVSTSFVGVMAIMLKPSQLITEIIQAMSITVMPATSRYVALKDKEMLRELFVRGTRYMTLVAALCWIVILLMMRPVLTLWMGPEYAYISPYVIVICGGTIFWMSGSCAFNMLRGMGMLRVSVISEFVGLVLVGLSSILVLFKFTGSPFIAVSVGLTLGQVVGSTMRLVYCIQATEVKPFRFFVHAYLHTLGLSILISIFAAGWIYFGHIKSFWSSAGVTIGAFVGFCLLFLLLLNETEKNMARELYKKLRQTVSCFILRKI
jgi:O-antigen/teichoic acid export membrane protein